MAMEKVVVSTEEIFDDLEPRFYVRDIFCEKSKRYQRAEHDSEGINLFSQ